MLIPSLTLGSGSPRRRDFLIQLGLDFTQVSPLINEQILPLETPSAYVLRLAAAKSHKVVGQLSGSAVVLSADTVVVYDGNILGKPESKLRAVEMLRVLSGNTHQVLTGVCVDDGFRKETFAVSTDVTFRKVTEIEAQRYWDTGEPCDKAGGYGLQGVGAMFVEAINGCYSNVIGLPLVETVRALSRFGIVPALLADLPLPENSN